VPLPDESAVAVVDEPRAPDAAARVLEHWAAREPCFVADPRAPEPRRQAQRARLGAAPLPPGAALVVASSGTTGPPRLVVHGRGPVEAAARAVSGALAVDPDRDRWLACVPLHFVAGLAIVVRAAVSGVPVTVHDGFDVDAVAAAAGPCTLVSLVATQLVRLLDAGAPLHRFRAVLLGGGPAPAGLVDRARAAGVAVHLTYGLTETFGGCVHDGHALPGVRLAIAPDDGPTGEILVGGPVMLEYLGDPDGTAAAFTPDRMLRTGDVGALAPDGTLRVVDRRRDLVITGGVNVSPTAVEAVLADDPAVADVAVIGVADPEWGERVVACVVAADPARPPTAADLRARAAGRLTPAELPRAVRLVDAIPRTASGKPRRGELRAGEPGSASGPARSSL
jgi:O-succinylbenzoic acid--CoA ligase